METKVLLVEDNELNREALKRRLEKRGFRVATAVNGSDSLSQATNLIPDIILMDLSLPVLDGWTVTKELRQQSSTEHIPIIALTAHAMSGDRQRALDAGCDEYETKPINLKNLLLKIEQLSSKHQRSKDALRNDGKEEKEQC